MSRLPVRLASVVALAALAACNDGGPNAAGGSDLSSNCSDGSWIGGTTEICDGVLTYRDYVYDDHGATSGLPRNPQQIGNLSLTAGNAQYATDPDPNKTLNTADLVKLTLALSGGQLAVTAELNTLFKPDSTWLAVGIDSDNNPDTGAAKWTDAGLKSVTSKGLEEIHVFKVGDPATNLIGGSIPQPAGAVWRVQALVAQSDGTVMNVAFRGTDEEAKGLSSSAGQSSIGAGDWWVDKQAKALTKGDITAFAAVVGVNDLKPGVTRADNIGPGLHERIYLSQFTGGEGVVPMPGRSSPCAPIMNFLGKYQPYGLYIPNKAGPHGLQFVMHGCDANHASLINSAGMQGRFGEDLNRILLVPLGRGPIGWYGKGLSERDVLDSWADVLANYDVDRDQVFSGGYSMGGYGTLRFAALYPDQFAGAVNWVGFTGDLFNTPIPGNPIPAQTASGGPAGSSSVGADVNIINYLENLSHVPIANLYSGADELVHVNTGTAMEQAFEGAPDVPYIFYFHPAAEHLTYAVLDNWVKEAKYSAGRTRVHNPPHVLYHTDAALDAPNFGIKHDRAYWVSQIVGRAAGDILVDLTSAGCGGSLPKFTDGQDAGPDPVPWVATQRDVTGANPITVATKLSGTLTNVASLMVDTAAACLGGTIAYDLTVDGPADLSLGGRVLHLPAAGHQQGTF